MATKLEKPLKREVQIGEQPYMLTISPEGLKLVPKGKRNGLAADQRRGRACQRAQRFGAGEELGVQLLIGELGNAEQRFLADIGGR